MIVGFIGMPRSGKTTYVARYIHKYGNRYNHIYICGDTLVDGYVDDPSFVTYIHPYEVGTFKPIEDSLFILCEAGTYFNNRLFMTIPHYCIDFFALHGHYKSGTTIVWESQTANVDCQLLDKTNKLYIVSKSLVRSFSHSVQVTHKIRVNPDSGQLEEIYNIPDGLIQRLTALLTFRYLWIFRPFYYGIFDTHADILFKGEPYLKKDYVYKECPKSFVAQLNYYTKGVNLYEKQKMQQTIKHRTERVIEKNIYG